MLVAGIWAGLAWGRDGTTPLRVSGVTAAVLAGGLLVGVLPRTHRAASAA
jgi:hypothetical protein